MGLLHDDIKNIVQAKVDSMQLTKLEYATYQADGSIILDTNVEPYPAQSLVIPDIVKNGIKFQFEGCTNPECTCEAKEYVLVEPLKAGDRVIFIRDMGGQKNLIIGRVPSE